MPGRHPDDDMLADLAADVLPLEQARAVEAHVLDCDRCAALLSDAEHVRGLLLASDAGPVPPEIWSRIEAALQAAGSPRAMEERKPAPPPPPAPEARRVDATGPGAWDAPDPLDDPHDWATTVQPPVRPLADAPTARTTGNLRRLSASRRDARPERRRRPGALLLGAAAAVVLLLAVGTVRLVQSGRGPATAAFDSSSSSAGSAASSSAAGSTPGNAAAGVAAAGPVIERSDTNYTAAS